MMTLRKFLVIKNTYSVVSGAMELLREGNMILFILLFGFSVVFPVCKLVFLFRVWNTAFSDIDKVKRDIRIISILGKWSMLDVFAVAVLLMSVKLGALASVRIHYGLYVFAVSILLTMVVTAKVEQIAGSYERVHRSSSGEKAIPKPDGLN